MKHEISAKKSVPGVLREQGISDEGLQQWIKRYGDAARDIVEQYKFKKR